MKSDVVVVGSGAAGLMAALSAASNGASVTVLERSHLFGGISAHSGGGMWIPNNFLQVRSGIRDTPEDAETHLRGLTLGTVPDDLIHSFVREAPKAIDLLTTETELEFVNRHSVDDNMAWVRGSATHRSLGAAPYDTNRLGELRDRIRRPIWPGGIPPITWQEMATFQGRNDHWGWVPLVKERIEKGIAVRGHALVAGLLEACVRKGVNLVANARGRSLTRTNGRIAGVVVSHDGDPETYEGRLGVVLACGGFEWNIPMWDDLVKIPLDGRLSPRLDEGDGLRMATQAGARLGGLHQAYFVPTVGRPADMYEGNPKLRLDARRLFLPGSIVVNRRGKRFADESSMPNHWVQKMVWFDPTTLEFPNLPAFLVFDRLNRESYPLLWEDWSFDVDGRACPEWVLEAPTIRQLAQKIGVDPIGLDEQVKVFNHHAERGQDPAFGRGDSSKGHTEAVDTRFSNPSIRPLGPGPYYAYRLQLSAWGTQGGPILNGNAQVVDWDDRPVPGLYAAGTVAAAVLGSAFPTGAALGSGVTFGYIAGRSVTSL